MKRNGKLQNALRGYRQGGIGMKKLTALLLALALTLAMLCAVAEGLDEELILGESTRATGEPITIEDEATGKGETGLALADDAILDGNGLVVDGLSLDGLEDNLLTDGLPEQETVAEAPANDLAGNESNPEDFEIDENGVLVEYVGPGGDVVIPDGVTAIGWEAFSDCSSLTSVTIPDSVTSIGYSAFSGCESLTSVTIPDGVASIDHSTFAYCSSLTSVTIPDSVTSIGEGAFSGCESLTSVTIPDSVTSIGDSAFSGCESLTSVTIPDGVTSIGWEAFSDCSSLTSVTIPDSVTSIGWSAFGDCSSLTSVTIPGSVTSIDDRAFDSCSSLTSVTIQEGVISIGEAAFLNCDMLKDVYIPSSVNEIGAYTFCVCYDEEFDYYDARIIHLTIHGYVGSYAESYAKEYGFDFTPTGGPVNLAEAEVTVPAQVYSAEAKEPSVTVVLDGRTLIKDIDYTVAYENNTAIGTATVTIEGKGNYTGTATATFKINPEEVFDLKLVAGNGELTASWTKSVGGITGYQLQYGLKKNFSGAKKATVNKAATVKATLKKLKQGKIYYVRIRAWKKIGDTTYWSAWSPAKKAKVKSGSSVSLAKAKVTVPAQVYSGKAKKPSVKVVLDGKTLKEGTDYTVAYRNNKAIGTATVTVTGMGKYTGTAKATFNINPKAVSGLKLAAGKGRLTASWKKSVGGVSGYQLQYGVKADFSGAKKSTVNNAATVKATLKNLKRGRTYYVRIRAGKKIGKTIYWSAWSAAKKVKVK